jgi:hypothetical protein
LVEINNGTVAQVEGSLTGMNGQRFIVAGGVDLIDVREGSDVGGLMGLWELGYLDVDSVGLQADFGLALRRCLQRTGLLLSGGFFLDLRWLWMVI